MPTIAAPAQLLVPALTLELFTMSSPSTRVQRTVVPAGTLVVVKRVGQSSARWSAMAVAIQTVFAFLSIRLETDDAEFGCPK